MATAAHSTHEPLAVRTWNDDGEADSKSERYLARRLAAAGADFKGVAVTTFLLGAAVAALLWVAAGIVLEHWLIVGGLPRWARWTWLLSGLGVFAAAAVRWIVPLVRYRVNLVYAARVIEREHPELHNDLVNTVLVKAHPGGNAAAVVRSLERRAARRLAAVPTETVIDRSIAVRLAYALALLVGLASVYSLAAPKSMLTTAARLFAPWARLAAPTRVGIEAPRLRWRMPGEAVVGQPVDVGGAEDSRRVGVEAGRATLVRGRQLVVGCMIHGLRRDERPTILVTPLPDGGGGEGGAVPWRAELTRMPGEGRDAVYMAVLPDAARGLDQSMSFTIEAGDARSEPIGVTLVDSPSLLVREVRYEFPAYMRRQAETVAWQGDLRGAEGTRVVIVAEGNQPLESAWIDFGCDGSRDLRLKVAAGDPRRATGTFVLLMNAERTAAEHASYRLVFQSRGGTPAASPVMETEKLEHRIEVLADLAPEITIEEPQESPARVPPGAPVTVRVRALDPDFGLARVAIETRGQDGVLQPEIVLPGSAREGAFNGRVQLVPERLGAGPGSRLEYRGVAVDTRPSTPNVTRTPWKVLQIDASAPPRPADPPPAASRNPGDAGAEGDSAKGADGDRGASAADGDDGAAGDDGRPADGSQDGRGDETVGDAENAPEPRRSGDRTRQGADQKPEQGRPEQAGDQQGEPRQGQQNGAAGGSNQGKKQPQSGSDAQQGASQGQGSEAGNVTPRGDARGTDGKGAGGGRSDGPQEDGKQGRGGDQAGKREASRQAGGNQQGAAADGESGRGGQPQDRQPGGERGGDKPPRSAVAADGTNDGEAMERILEHRRQAAGGEASGEKSGGEKSGGEKSGGEKSGGEKSGGEKSGGEKSGGEKSGGEKSDPSGDAEHEHPEQQSPPCAAADGKPCGKQGCSSCKGGSKSSAGGEAGAQGGQGQQGQGQQGQGQQGQGQQGQDDGSNGNAGEAGQQSGGKAAAGPAGEKQARAKGDPDEQGKAGGEPSGRPAATGSTQGATESSPIGGGGWSEGAAAPQAGGPAADTPPASRDMEWGPQELANARNAADLAIEHLRKTVESGRTDVLDELGWTRDQARAFLERWEAMRRQADGADQQKRGEFERVLRSLGLRPAGARSSRDVPADVKGGQAEGRRSRPPSDYRERFKAFLQGTSGGAAAGDTGGARSQ